MALNKENTIFERQNWLTGRTEIENTFRGIGVMPIGGVAAWLKSLTNTPPLPDGWVECNGQTLNDPISVYHNSTIPDLNGTVTTNHRFLRGQSTSGETGGQDNMPAHTHTIQGRYGTTGSTRIAGGYDSNPTTFCTDTTSSSGTGATADENKPPYYNVVWVMRVR